MYWDLERVYKRGVCPAVGLSAGWHKMTIDGVRN